MANVTFVQTANPSGGAFFYTTSPQTSQSFTPGAGDALIAFGLSPAGASPITGVTGTGTYSLIGSTDVDSGGNYLGLYANSSASAGSQTAMIAGVDRVGMLLCDCSNVGSIASPVYTNNDSPGTGAGAVTGSPVVVPTGGMLLALCYNSTTNVTTAVITGTAGTSQLNQTGGNPPSLALQSYAGAGSSVTPAFTISGAGAGTESYTVIQVLLSPISTTVTASAGVYSYTGIAAGLQLTAFTPLLLANSGTYNYIGAPSVSDQSVSFAFGSYVYTGESVNLSELLAGFSAAYGSYAITGIPQLLSPGIGVPMPNFIGMEYLAAQTALIAAGFQNTVPLEATVSQGPNSKFGFVIAQSIPPGTFNYVPGSTLQLTVNVYRGEALPGSAPNEPIPYWYFLQ